MGGTAARPPGSDAPPSPAPAPPPYSSASPPDSQVAGRQTNTAAAAGVLREARLTEAGAEVRPAAADPTEPCPDRGSVFTLPCALTEEEADVCLRAAAEDCHRFHSG